MDMICGTQFSYKVGLFLCGEGQRRLIIIYTGSFVLWTLARESDYHMQRIDCMVNMVKGE